MKRIKSGMLSPFSFPAVFLIHFASAYIAASRRSDRSLEARVESARRASEIHKRRTGRSLRVTEQDVVNEEMYEEEDDDLPFQYRRLTAHLQTGSADFNRRLSAYLTNHVAMRSALDQAITNSYAQQYPNAPSFAHNQQGMYPSPFQAPSIPPQPMRQQYPQNNFAMAPSTNYQQMSHARSQSAAGPQEIPRYSQSLPTSSPAHTVSPVERRRTSVPSKSVSPPGSTTRTPQLMQARPSVQHSPSSYNIKQETRSPKLMQGPPQSLQRPHTFPQPTSYQDFSLLTTSLPTETQQMLGPSLDPNDPLTSMFMAGSEHMPQPFQHSAPLQKPRNFCSPYDGMSATLAPSALDMTPHHDSHNPSLAPSGSMSAPPLQMSFSDFDFGKGQFYNSGGSSHGSGSATPGFDGSWDAFIDTGAWTENPA